MKKKTKKYAIGGYNQPNTQYGEQSAFNQYLLDYFKNNPEDAEFNPNVINPDSTFEVSDELKNRLKKNHQEISPIRKYGDNLQYDIKTGTGQFDFSPEFQGFNALAQITTGVANMAKDAKTRRYENNQYLQALTPQPKYSYNEAGLNNIPMFRKGGINDLTSNRDEQMALTKLSLKNGSPDIRIRNTIWNPFEWGYAGRYNTNKNRIIINNSPKKRKSGELLKEIVANSNYKDINGLDNFKVNAYISELAHAKDKIDGTQDNNKANKELLKNFFSGDRKNVYHDHSAEEYRVHKIIEPQLRNEYLQELDSFKNGGETRAKFFKILRDGEVHGKKLTDKQRKFFGAMAFKKYGDGGAVVPPQQRPTQYHYNIEQVNNTNIGFNEKDYKPTMQAKGSNWKPVSLEEFKTQLQPYQDEKTQQVKDGYVDNRKPTDYAEYPYLEYDSNGKPTGSYSYQASPNYTGTFNSLNNIPYTQLQQKDNINIKGQKVNIPMYSNKGVPVYGPNNTLIGYHDDKNIFRKTLNHSGAPNNIDNQKDNQLLNNPSELLKYVEKQGYKFQNGGQTPDYYNPLTSKFIEDYLPMTTDGSTGGLSESYQNAFKYIIDARKAYLKAPTEEAKQKIRDEIYSFENDISSLAEKDYNTADYNTAVRGYNTLAEKEKNILNSQPKTSENNNFKDKYFSQYKGEIPFEMLANMVNGIPGYDDMPYTPPTEWNKEKSKPQNFPYFPDNNTDPKRVVKTIYTNPPTYILADGTEVMSKEMSKSNPVMFGQENNQGPLTNEELNQLEQLSTDYKNQYHKNDWLKNLTAQFTVDPRIGNTQNDSFIGPPNYPDEQPIQQNGEWVFTPQRVDYNKKYVPLPKNQSSTTTSSTKTQSKSTTPVKTQSSTRTTTTTPKTVISKPQEKVLPKKIVHNDIWNNPNGSDEVKKTYTQAPQKTVVDWYKDMFKKADSNLKNKKISYPHNTSYLPKYQDGGLNEGSEVDLTDSEIQDLISKGYKIEIL